MLAAHRCCPHSRMPSCSDGHPLDELEVNRSTRCRHNTLPDHVDTANGAACKDEEPGTVVAARYARKSGMIGWC